MVHQFWENVTLEPMLFVKMVAEGNVRVVADSLEIDRVCRVNLNFSAEDCLNMDDGNHTDVQVKTRLSSNVFIEPFFIEHFAGRCPKVSKYFQLLPKHH